MFFRKVLLVLLLASFVGFGLAQRCVSELQAGLDEAALSAPASGRDAAVHLKLAVDLLEPALPPLIQVRGGPLPEDDPLADTIRFLSERELLPMSWQPDMLTVETWRAMLESLAGWYDVPAPQVEVEVLTRADLVADLSALIGRISPTLRPVALVASDGENKDRVAFWSVIRNDSVYPRMIIKRPPDEGVNLAQGIESALPALSNCAFSVSSFVFAPADTAQRLFLANNEARMVIAQREPSTGQGLEYVPSGQETAYFTFAAPALENVASYAALFVGKGVPVMSLLQMIPQLRTNMSPRELIDFVSAP